MRRLSRIPDPLGESPCAFGGQDFRKVRAVCTKQRRAAYVVRDADPGRDLLEEAVVVPCGLKIFDGIGQKGTLLREPRPFEMHGVINLRRSH